MDARDWAKGMYEHLSKIVMLGIPGELDGEARAEWDALTEELVVARDLSGWESQSVEKQAADLTGLAQDDTFTVLLSTTDGEKVAVPAVSTARKLADRARRLRAAKELLCL